MTAMDTTLVVLAVIDVIAVCVMAFVGAQFMETGQQTSRKVKPAIEQCKALAATGKALVDHGRNTAGTVTTRVKDVTAHVRARIERTRRIALELRPRGVEATDAVKMTHAQLVDRAETVANVGRRLSRLRTAAEAAAAAARREA